MPRLTVLCAVLLPCLAACAEEDPAPLYFKVDYQVRCIDCDPLAMDDPERKIRGLDGERGFSVSCRSTVQGGDRYVTMSALHETSDPASNYGITIAQVNLEADDPGGNCRVTVVEGNNTYEGVCSEDDPAPAGGCKVDIDVDGTTIQGSVFCNKIPNRSTTEFVRYVVAPSSDEPAEFEVQGCEGL